MALTQFRTKDERTRALWAEKFMSVAEGKLYTQENDDHSPFPIHSYLKNKLLGSKIKMLEMNAGAALVEHFVADTLTNMTITINEEEKSEEEQQILDWFTQIDFDSKLDEVARSFYGNGYGVQQLFRTLEGKENGFTVTALDPSTWYPDIPTFSWQPVTSGRVISVFSELDSAQQIQWYAFVETHTAGKVEYSLLRLEQENSLEGKKVALNTLERFAGLETSVATDLDFIPIIQADRQKSSRHVCGTSLLYPIWDILQEVSEIQTQLRQERIKHLRAKMAAPMQSLARVERDRVDTPMNSKQQNAAAIAINAGLYDMNQELFPVPAGSTVMPAYIQRDLESITKGMELIDSLLSKAAAMIGAPKSVFNIEEAAGNVKVDTEKRKDRRYVRKILQGQARIATLVEQVIQTYWQWNGKEDVKAKVAFESPFNLTQEETVQLVKDMNPMATLISEEDGFNMVHKDKTPDERAAMLARIKGEKQEMELAQNAEIAL
jgi:hypothetical protein